MMRRPFSSIFIRAARTSGRSRAVRSPGAWRDANREYVELRRLEVDEKNARLERTVQYLESILAVGLARNPNVELARELRAPGNSDLATEAPAPTRPDRASFGPPHLGFIGAFAPGTKRKRAEAVEAADAAFRAATAERERLMVARDAAIQCRKVDDRARDNQIDALSSALAAGELGAVKTYVELVLARSPYPDGFHHEVEIDYDAMGELAVELRAPAKSDIIPKIECYVYHKADDRIVAIAKAEEGREALYARVIAQFGLRTFHEIFAANAGWRIAAATLAMHVVEPDPGTGRTLSRGIVRARVERTEFEALELAAVDPIVCLERLTARSARSGATPLAPVSLS